MKVTRIEKMIVSCIFCDRQIETKNEDVVVTVDWIYKELIGKNNLQTNKNISRIVKICTKCWENSIKDKPKGNDYYWLFNKSI